MERSRPLLVTGMPRSGTTWLGRLLATAPGTALVGREPMNPHRGQYRLAGTLNGWAELRALSPPQRRALRTAYAGVNPATFGRYGVRQRTAPLPRTRIVIKDPFAMLSLPVVTEATGATPVLIYRHPGAVLDSYRRMGWRSDIEELRPVLLDHWGARGAGPLTEPLPDPGETSEADQIGRFWAALYEIALDNAARTDDLCIVSHEELAGGGIAAVRALFERLALTLSAATEREVLRKSPGSQPVPSRRLHNFDRAPGEVAEAWRRRLSPSDVEDVEKASEAVLRRLGDGRCSVSG